MTAYKIFINTSSVIGDVPMKKNDREMIVDAVANVIWRDKGAFPRFLRWCVWSNFILVVAFFYFLAAINGVEANPIMLVVFGIASSAVVPPLAMFPLDWLLRKLAEKEGKEGYQIEIHAEKQLEVWMSKFIKKFQLVILSLGTVWALIAVLVVIFY